MLIIYCWMESVHRWMGGRAISTQLNEEKGSLYTAEQGDRVINHSWTRRQGHYIQIHKKWGYFIHLNKEAGLTNVRRSSVCRGVVFRTSASRGKTVVDIFNICTWIRGRLCHPPSITWGRCYHFHGAESVGSLTWLCPCQAIHICSAPYLLPILS